MEILQATTTVAHLQMKMSSLLRAYQCAKYSEGTMGKGTSGFHYMAAMESLLGVFDSKSLECDLVSTNVATNSPTVITNSSSPQPSTSKGSQESALGNETSGFPYMTDMDSIDLEVLEFDFISSTKNSSPALEINDAEQSALKDSQSSLKSAPLSLSNHEPLLLNNAPLVIQTTQLTANDFLALRNGLSTFNNARKQCLVEPNAIQTPRHTFLNFLFSIIS